MGFVQTIEEPKIIVDGKFILYDVQQEKKVKSNKLKVLSSETS